MRQYACISTYAYNKQCCGRICAGTCTCILFHLDGHASEMRTEIIDMADTFQSRMRGRADEAGY